MNPVLAIILVVGSSICLLGLTVYMTRPKP